MKKTIFFKKRNLRFLFLLLFIFLSFIIYYFFFLYDYKYFEISKYKESFYIIPNDKGGKIIDNKDKKSMHLSDLDEDNINFNIDKNNLMNFSIQVFTSDDYKIIKNKFFSFLNSDEKIFIKDDLFIMNFRNNLRNEYFLLYKNFNTYDEARDYCVNFSFKLNKCLVVNVQNLIK
mgnify:CR=1 FL=1